MQCLYLSLYILVMSILFDAIASTKLEEKPKPNSPSNYDLDFILQLRLWAPLNVVLTQGFFQGFFKIDQGFFYGNRFYSLYSYHHDDHCLVNIVLLYYIQT